MLARVQNDSEFSDPFPVTNGIKQGCVLASTVFSMMFSAMLTDVFQDNGIPIGYHFDGKLSNKKVASRIKSADRGAKWVSLCWWHGKGCSNRRENAKKVWIKYLIQVTAMISQSASKRHRWYIGKHLESLTKSLPSQWKVNDCRW